MSAAIPFSTDLATLVVFDPQELQHRVRDAKGWWRVNPFSSLPEFQDGRCALLPIGREGSYRVRLLAEGALSEAEQAIKVGEVNGLPLLVTSGELFVGAAERLPGAGFGQRLSVIPDTGDILAVAPGEYTLLVSVLRWRDEDAYYDEDGEIVADAPADFVVQLRPRQDVPVPEVLPDLLELIPRAQATGKAKVGTVPRRRRSAPEPSRPRRRRSGGSGSAPAARPIRPPAAPRAVPEEIAPYDPETVKDAFREVLYGDCLHPPAPLTLDRVEFAPRNTGLMRHDVSVPDLNKKITRVREQLRVLEAKLNAHERLTLGEKVLLQAPISDLYESLTELTDFLVREAP